MILERMTASGRDGSHVKLEFSDGSALRVPVTLVADLGLYAHQELDEAAMEQLHARAGQASARERAVRIVSSAAVSEKMLEQKLVHRGESPEDARAAATWLKELGAVDDRDMARRVVENSIRKGYGKNRIRGELYAKGVPREYWDEALADLPDFSNAIDDFLERRFRTRPVNDREIKKAADALARRGHSWENISAALRRMEENRTEEDRDS